MSQRMLVVSLVVAALGCARPASTPPTLYAGQWRLASIGQSAALPADVTQRPWLQFAADSGRVSGNLSCNRASGTFTMEGETIRFGPMMSTKMACVDEGLNRQEAEFGRAIASTNRFRVRGDTLELLMDSRVLATLVRTP
jgi:heat shock protein HslJ